MAREKKYQNVVVISDSDDDDDRDNRAGDRRKNMKVSVEETEDLSASSDGEDQSDASSFHPSDDEPELSDSDEDYDDDDGYQQSEDDQRDEDEGGCSPSSDGGRPGDDGGSRDGGRAGDEDDDDSLCKRVVQLLQERRDIGNLSLKLYKAYLRKQGLRVSGTKAECLMRIHEHWRIKDGQGEALYPRSSFSLNCTGDVCKGDVVLFRQRVYQKYEKLTRSGKVQGSRTVAGRVVKESYGAAKQQHTFTVEVLWSKGAKKLPPLFPLLIKGRNLYRLKTYRQPWKNEAERSKALDEKHKRGAIARQKRDVRLQGRRMHKSQHSSDQGQRRQKHPAASNHTRDPRKNCSERGRHDDQRGISSYSTNPANKMTTNKANRARTFKPVISQQKVTINRNKASASDSYPDAPYEKFHGLQVQSDRRSAQYAFPRGHVPSSSSFTRPPAAGHYGSQSRHQAPSSYSYEPERLSSAMPLPTFHSANHMNQNRGLFNCSTRGCRNFGCEGCAISCCWQCCRRSGMRCNAHKWH